MGKTQAKGVKARGHLAFKQATPGVLPPRVAQAAAAQALDWPHSLPQGQVLRRSCACIKDQEQEQALGFSGWDATSCISVPGTESLLSFPFQLPAIHTLGATRDGSSAWAPATLLGDPDRIPGSCFGLAQPQLLTEDLSLSL